MMAKKYKKLANGDLEVTETIVYVVSKKALEIKKAKADLELAELNNG